MLDHAAMPYIVTYELGFAVLTLASRTSRTMLQCLITACTCFSAAAIWPGNQLKRAIVAV